ncbi:hypothetical protein K443DRAFT_249772 [Laccaria amethystina LaAM-08-1]|uniref:Unplaced genomic scaffold K443scaffold_16, whole genome shotgun sequence n=1 Tax=Laccaria amethystina LaAM-08-1 TaxID=1095629 RepID=A0A0C9X3L7_9AGAR|nr:hypothetical protein K443DRAFT_249772 [Laccaria amethystina LaAM-08-1]
MHHASIARQRRCDGFQINSLLLSDTWVTTTLSLKILQTFQRSVDLRTLASIALLVRMPSDFALDGHFPFCRDAVPHPPNKRRNERAKHGSMCGRRISV